MAWCECLFPVGAEPSGYHIYPDLGIVEIVDPETGALKGDGLALGEVIQPHLVLGPINIYQWLLFVGSHEARHTAQVREIAAQLNATNAAASAN